MPSSSGTSSSQNSSSDEEENKVTSPGSESGESSHSSNSGSESEAEEASKDTPEDPVLSHAEKRRQQRKQKQAETGAADDLPGTLKRKIRNTAELAPSKVPKRQNSVWVGNLSFKTTPESLRRFFEGVGEITRIHMPMKLASGGPGGAARKENRGFAYVDFATSDAKVVAITLSENNLDGRRLLIKDGDDFNGRPAAAAATNADGTAASSSNPSGHTKTAQKVLSAQKQPPGPTLFLGNLGFAATEESIRLMLESHRKINNAEEAEGSEAPKDKWIRKIRLGTFEDSGKCKGWAFIDFTKPEHATSALIDPRNHRLDGRALVVEYASPDAVRRGGGPRPEGKDGVRPSKPFGRDREKGGDEDGQEDRPRKRPRVDDRQDDTLDAAPQTEGGEDQPSTRAHARNSNRREREGKPPRVRSKPGAALAMAKRESVAIVPSQGKRIVF